MNIINPSTEELIITVAEDTTTTIEAKYNRLKQGQKSWAALTVKDRVAVLAKYQELLHANLDELADILTQEMGKPIWQSKNEIKGGSGRISYFLQNSGKYLAEEVVHQEPGLTEKIAYEPLGVIANISAWNYPYLVGINVYVPALIAGNAVLYKPSEFTTLTGIKIQELLYQAGVPKDVFEIVIGGASAGEALLQLPLNGYYFTGSYKTGKYIYEAVAPKMVPCQLELGGKDPLYVTEDNSDIAKVAAAAVEGAFYNNGQSCCAVERIYVHQQVYDAFLEAFIAEAKNWKLGNPTEEGTFISPLTRPAQLDVLAHQVDDAVGKGAALLLGGKRKEGKGYYFEPTVLANVTHDMLVMTEESFGPIIGIQKVSGDDEAIALMLDTEYGLTSSVYSNHYNRVEEILKKMDSGSVYWNCCDRVSPNLPWSGRKHSGIGATLSHLGIRAFTQPKGYHLRG